MKKIDSIIQAKDGRCLLCSMLDHEEDKYWSYIEKHHVFFGRSNRKHSEEDDHWYLAEGKYPRIQEAVIGWRWKIC